MFSISRTAVRASRSPICTQCQRQLSTGRSLQSSLLRRTSTRHPPLSQNHFALPFRLQNKTPARTYAEKSSADEVIELIQEQYATARDEFEIASEETEKKSVYAADDRAAAREELDNLKEMFQKAIDGENGEEVKRRVGQRIRELDHAIVALEQSALED